MFRIKNAITTLGVGGGNNEPSQGAGGETLSREAEDQVPPLTSPPPSSSYQDTTLVQSVPPWVREMNNSRATRHSRASSIVSTRTKFSTTTCQEDARSIDINVGGQYFRISRDGSRVTADAPPPYTGPGETVRFREGETSEVSSFDSRHGSDAQGSDGEDSEAEDGAVTPRSSFAVLDADAGVRANILDPTEFNMPSPVGQEQLTHRSSSATLVGSQRTDDFGNGRRSSYEAGVDIISGPRPNDRRTRTASQGAAPTLTRDGMPRASPLRRANGIRLPSLITSTDSSATGDRPRRSQQGSTPPPARPLQVRSAGAILSNMPGNREPKSPDYIGRNARGVFPFPIRAATTQNTSISLDPNSSLPETRSLEDHEVSEENPTPLAMDDENDISLHYARMMRKLDYGHRKALHLRDKELAELREKLHEKDTVLRQQLRAKDFIIDDLKQRLGNLEENVETMLEKARHQVEDLWESRWKDRDFHLRERMRRIEEEAHKTIERLRTALAETERGGNGAAARS